MESVDGPQQPPKWKKNTDYMDVRENNAENAGIFINFRHNHLDPNINKRPWSEQEEHTIFEAHKKYGNKWADISKYLHGRTDNSIKNHFYSTLRRSLRRINKLLGDKNSTQQVKDIKPGVLTKIFSMVEVDPEEEEFFIPSQDENFINTIQNSEKVKDCLLNFANQKPKYKNLTDYGEEISENFREIIQKIIEYKQNFNISQNYNEKRDDRLRAKKKNMIKKLYNRIRVKHDLSQQDECDFDEESIQQLPQLYGGNHQRLLKILFLGTNFMLEEEIIRKINRGDDNFFKVVKKDQDNESDEHVLREIHKKQIQSMIPPKNVQKATDLFYEFMSKVIKFIQNITPIKAEQEQVSQKSTVQKYDLNQFNKNIDQMKDISTPTQSGSNIYVPKPLFTPLSQQSYGNQGLFHSPFMQEQTVQLHLNDQLDDYVSQLQQTIKQNQVNRETVSDKKDDRKQTIQSPGSNFIQRIR